MTNYVLLFDNVQVDNRIHDVVVIW